MMFLYIESVKFHPSTSISTKIDLEGRAFESYRHFTLVHNFAFFHNILGWHLVSGNRFLGKDKQRLSRVHNEGLTILRISF